MQREAMMLFFLQNFGRIAFEKTNLCKTYAKMLNIKEKEVERTERRLLEFNLGFYNCILRKPS